MRGFWLFALAGAIDGPHRKLRSRRMPLVVAAAAAVIAGFHGSRLINREPARET